MILYILCLGRLIEDKLHKPIERWMRLLYAVL